MALKLHIATRISLEVSRLLREQFVALLLKCHGMMLSIYIYLIARCLLSLGQRGTTTYLYIYNDAGKQANSWKNLTLTSINHTSINIMRMEWNAFQNRYQENETEFPQRTLNSLC